MYICTVEMIAICIPEYYEITFCIMCGVRLMLIARRAPDQCSTCIYVPGTRTMMVLIG